MSIQQAAIGIRPESRSSVAALGVTNSPYVVAWPFTHGVGFGTRFSNPASLPPNTLRWTTFNNARTILMGGTVFTTWHAMYPLTATGGFGAKFALPTTNFTDTGGSSGYNDIHPTDKAYIISSNSTPGIHAWKWDNVTGFGTKYANPSAGYTSTRALAFNASGNAVFIVSGNTPQARRWDNVNGFGTAYSNANAALGTPTSVSGHPRNLSVVFSADTTPWIGGWYWTDANGYGTKMTNPSTLPTTGNFGNASKYSLSGNRLVTNANNATAGNQLAAYQMNTDGSWGTKFAAPTTAPGSGGTALMGISAEDLNILPPTVSSPFITAYQWTATAFGTKYANPTAIAFGAPWGSAFN